MEASDQQMLYKTASSPAVACDSPKHRNQVCQEDFIKYTNASG